MNNIIILIGILLIAIGTWLTIWGTGRETKKDNKELIEGKNTLIAQNEKLRAELAERDRQLTEIAKKDIYKALSQTIRKRIIDNIKSQSLKDLKEITISDLNTDNNGKRIVSDMISLLADAGINVKRGNTGIAFGTSVIEPQIKMNKDSIEATKQLCEILSPYLKVKYAGMIDDSLDKGNIHIIISGTPLFHEDGSVEFK